MKVHRTPEQWKVAIGLAIERSKAEILADIASGRVPEGVRSFGDLHDYVDANEYGGLCEDGPGAFSESYAEGECKPCDVGSMTLDSQIAASTVQEAVDEWIRQCNKVQTGVDRWLKRGRTE